jgi:hypothetical protein
MEFSVKYVYVLIDSDKDVVAIYENLDIAKKLKGPLEEGELIEADYEENAEQISLVRKKV